MIELLQHQFIIRSFIIGLVAAFSTALVGNFLVASKQSLISDMLAHTALAGVGIGVFLQINPVLVAIVASLISSLILWSFWYKKKTPDAIAMLLLTGGLALAVFFTHLSPTSTISFETFLFGNILTINKNEMIFFLLLNLIIILLILFNWNRLLSTIFDRDFAKSRFKNIRLVELLLFCILGILVASSSKNNWRIVNWSDASYSSSKRSGF